MSMADLAAAVSALQVELVGVKSRMHERDTENESLRETTYRAVITPGVDFTALDYVGVVVPSGTDGPVIEADGSLR